MSDAIVILAIYGGALLLLSPLLLWQWRHSKRQKAILDEQERSFEEKIRAFPFDEAQLKRLQNQIDRVGVVMFTGLPSRSGSGDTSYHVFAVDAAGATHDVVTTGNLEFASQTAHGLARAWNVRLDDERAGLLAAEECLPEWDRLDRD